MLHLVGALPAAAMQPSPRVLIINSYHQGFGWSDQELAGVLEKLYQGYPALDPAIEHLDAKRFPGDRQRARNKEYLAGKYQGQNLDLVMALDIQALDLVLRHRGELFPGTPVVFAGIEDFSPEMLLGHDRITGVTETRDYLGTIKLALTLHPKTKEVLVISDYTGSGRAMQREIERTLAASPLPVKISFTPPSAIEAVLNQLKTLSPDSLGLISSFTTDRLGFCPSLAENTRRLAAYPVPLYSTCESRLGKGIVGGMILQGREHGRLAGDLALRVLAGEDPAAIPVQIGNISQPMFDYRQLQRFHIPRSALPAGSLIINLPESFFQQNKKWIWTVSAITIFFSLAVLILSINSIHRRTAEKALQASEIRLHSIIDCTSEAIITVDHNYAITSVNPAFTRLLGYTESEALGRAVSLIHASPGSFEEFKEMVIPAIDQAGYWRGECDLKKKNGSLAPTELSLVPQQLPDGVLIGYIGAFRDISERRQTEKELRKSEEKYRLVFENAPLGILHYDEHGIVTDLNESLANIIGAPQESIIGSNMLGQLQDDRIRQAVAASLSGRQIGYYEGEYRSVVGGRKTHLRAFFQGVFAEIGTFLGGIGIFEDYSGKYLAEQKRQESLNFLETLLDAIPNPIFYRNAEGRYLGCNKACKDAWGASMKDIFGKTVFDLHPPDLARIYHAKDMELFANPGEVQTYETALAHADGARMDVILHKAVFFNLDGTPGGLIGVAVDITGRKQAEEQMLASLREKEVLLKEIHHRVKNNMQIISTLLSLQSKYYDEGKNSAEVFRDCQSRIRSMALIHESLYSTEDLANINFRRYLEKLASRLLASYGSGSQSIKVSVAGTEVKLDISQAVPCGLIANELVVNALKHAFPGKQGGEIVVSIERLDGRRVLEIKDNGVGLGPGFDLENPLTFGWLMVQNLAKQLGGELTVHSRGGTHCRITF